MLALYGKQQLLLPLQCSPCTMDKIHLHFSMLDVDQQINHPLVCSLRYGCSIAIFSFPLHVSMLFSSFHYIEWIVARQIEFNGINNNRVTMMHHINYYTNRDSVTFECVFFSFFFHFHKYLRRRRMEKVHSQMTTNVVIAFA